MGTGLAKKAKTLTTQQINKMLDHLRGTRYPTRNRTILLLSVKAGLRAKEISELTWSMVLDPEGVCSRNGKNRTWGLKPNGTKTYVKTKVIDN